MSQTLQSSVSAPLLGLSTHKDDSEYYPRSRPARNRNSITTLLWSITFMGICLAAITLLWSRSSGSVVVIDATPADIRAASDIHALHEATSLIKPSEEEIWKAKVNGWVNGAPTQNFRYNLRDDTQYITTWVAGGWTNDFMTYINMVYLGLLTSRIPVLPPFAPSHVDHDGGYPPFGDIFDVPRLSEAIHSPLLEWRDVKREGSAELDLIGCWSIWGLVGNQEGAPRYSLIPQQLKLDVAYTALPEGTDIISDFWMPFWSLAQLGFPGRRTQALATSPPQTPAPQSGVVYPPEEQLLCFDFMYYVGAARQDEWWYEWSPAWRFVGTHAHWTKPLEQLALGYVRRALELPDDDSEEFPQYISVHVRRGDFTAACGHTSADECFQPLATYAQHVSDVRTTLLTTLGIDIPAHHVLVTSDEADAAWWGEVRALGWRWADHAAERTEARYGKWYLPLVDAVVQSMGVGFVGTDHSTMSLVAKRRVEDWRGGVGVMVKIGP